MRPLLLLCAALLLAGCDAFFDPDDTRDREAFMERLEGTWTQTGRAERIDAGGTVTVTETYPARTAEVAREVTCAGDAVFRSEGDEYRVMVTYDPATPTTGRQCVILTVDRTRERIVFLGPTTDVAATLVVDERDRKEWHLFSPLGDGTATRTVTQLAR